MTDTAVRATVHGRVQGVFFRDSTRQQAERHGVRGWVRNDPSGTVSAHLEGDEPAVQAVLEWMRAGGPPQATVERVEVEDVAPDGGDGFAVVG